MCLACKIYMIVNLSTVNKRELELVFTKPTYVFKGLKWILYAVESSVGS